MNWWIGLVWIAGRLGRDLQAPARRAGGGERLWNATPARLTRAFGGDGDLAARFAALRRTADPTLIGAELREAGAWVWTPDERADDDGLRRLDPLPDAPFALIGCGTQIGRLITPSAPVVAIVGSRHPTAEGLRLAQALAGEIAARGGVVVSGLALGIDAAAHRGALSARGGTVAILGCGIGVDHPRTNSRLRADILAAGGTVAAEYWPDTQPAPWRFPARNRIVAGLSDAVVVVEAAARSGALITADFALELGRPVLAVPGRARAPQSAGCHALLRAGAALCEDADDVIAEIPERGWTGGTVDDPVPALDGLAAIIHELLRCEPLAMDEVVARTGAGASVVAVTMSELELAGLVVSNDGQRYWAASLRGAA